MDKTFNIELSNGETVTVEVDEFHPYEPSAYCHDPGWTTFTVGTTWDDQGELTSGTEYFINTSGDAFIQPSNEVVGTVAELVEAFEQLEAQSTPPCKTHGYEFDLCQRETCVADAQINHGRCPVCGGSNPGDITHTRC